MEAAAARLHVWAGPRPPYHRMCMRTCAQAGHEVILQCECDLGAQQHRHRAGVEGPWLPGCTAALPPGRPLPCRSSPLILADAAASGAVLGAADVIILLNRCGKAVQCEHMLEVHPMDEMLPRQVTPGALSRLTYTLAGQPTRRQGEQ
eukprot:360976-Chlamydomonas_euryale.AAC.4